MHRHVVLLGGIAVQSAAYPPKLVKAVLKGLKEQLLEDGELSAVDLRFGGPNPTSPTFEVQDDNEASMFHQVVEKVYDSVSGEELPAELVKKARDEEIEWVRKIQLYDKVPRAEAKARGAKIITVRWVDHNKGDPDKYNVRSRLVARE